MKTVLLCDRLYNILLSRRFSREGPTNPRFISINEIIKKRIDSKVSLELMVLWGGSKEGIPGDDADMKSLDHLANMHSLLKEFYPTKTYLLFCDMHHVIANGIDYGETLNYYQSLYPVARERGLDILTLSSILGQDEKNYLRPSEEQQAEKLLRNNSLKELFIEKSKKHSKLLMKSPERIDEVTRLYVQIELYFLNIINDSYAPIFISFSDPRIQRPIAETANVPMLYFWSKKGHHSEVPWYNKKPCEDLCE